MNRWKTRLRKLGIWAAWGFATLCVLWIAAYLWTGRLLERETSEALRLGPLDFAALLPPDVPAGDNGIWEFQRAAALLEEKGRGWTFLDRSSEWTPDIAERAAAGIRETEEIRTLARRAADRKAIRFLQGPKDGDAILTLRLPHVSQGMQLARYLRACARIEASEGQPGEALDELARIARIARSLEDEPLLLSGLVSAALRGMVFSEADRLLKEGPPIREEALRRFSDELRTRDGLARHFLLGERCLAMASFDQWSASCTPARPWLRWEAAAYLRFFNAAIPAAGDMGRPLPDPRIRGAILCNLLMPALQKGRTAFGVAQARSGLVRWGLAVLQHRARTGKLPASLDGIPVDLIEDRPTDPFSGKPFAYLPAADGASFSIQGAGKDLDGKDLGISWKAGP